MYIVPSKAHIHAKHWYHISRILTVTMYSAGKISLLLHGHVARDISRELSMKGVANAYSLCRINNRLANLVHDLQPSPGPSGELVLLLLRRIGRISHIQGKTSKIDSLDGAVLCYAHVLEGFLRIRLVQRAGYLVNMARDLLQVFHQGFQLADE